jgi:hypothetical protein
MKNESFLGVFMLKNEISVTFAGVLAFLRLSLLYAQRCIERNLIDLVVFSDTTPNLCCSLDNHRISG